VLAVSLTQAPGETVVTALVRLNFSTHLMLGQIAWQDAHTPVDAAAAAQRISASRPPFVPPGWQVAADQLLSLGEFWVLWVSSPSPTADFGGTMIVQASTGRLVYAASTLWQGGGHLFP